MPLRFRSPMGPVNLISIEHMSFERMAFLVQRPATVGIRPAATAAVLAPNGFRRKAAAMQTCCRRHLECAQHRRHARCTALRLGGGNPENPKSVVGAQTRCARLRGRDKFAPLPKTKGIVSPRGFRMTSNVLIYHCERPHQGQGLANGHAIFLHIICCPSNSLACRQCNSTHADAARRADHRLRSRHSLE